MGKYKYSGPYLGKVEVHNVIYERTLGKVVGFGLPGGGLPAWYFAGGPGARLEFRKRIPSARFLNVES